MLERLILTVLISGAGVGLWIAYNRWTLTRTANLAPTDPVLVNVPSGSATILYFTTPTCQICRTLQEPALTQLTQDESAVSSNQRVQIIKIDAVAQPDVADRWGVFSAPTTFVLNVDRLPLHVNRGYASVETLKRQLESV